MPSAVTHELIAAQTLKLLPNSAVPMAESAMEYYYLGAQGGDVFFFYKPLLSNEYNFGKFVHRFRVYELFCAMCEHLKTLTGEELTKARAYCLGYISHYSTDVCFHPFVYRYLKRVQKGKKLLHTRIENDWDVYFARTRKNVSVEHYNFPFSPAKLATENVLYPLLCAIGQKLQRKPISKNALTRALKNYERYLKFFHGGCYNNAKLGDKLGLKKLSSLFPHETPLNDVLDGEEFTALAGGKDRNADELFERAATDGARRMILFIAALDGAPLPREEFSRHLLTGQLIEE